MGVKRIGEQTIKYDTPPVIASAATAVGAEEGKGPLAQDFDIVLEKQLYGEATPEKAERKLLLETARLAVKKNQLQEKDIDYFLAGDLLNQIVASSFAARALKRPFFGLYGACSTFCMGLALAGMLVDGGFAKNVLLGVSSHYESAERQFRYPVETNIKKSQTAQFTVTGAGSCVIAGIGQGVRILGATTGRPVDYGVKKSDKLGSCMAPGAAHTIVRHFKDVGGKPDDYDLILTGDLGKIGTKLVRDLVQREGYRIQDNHRDCGTMIFDIEKQSVGAGGSGCACSAVVTLGTILNQIQSGTYQRVLVVATGALHSPLSCRQGETIPGVAHAVLLEGV